MNILRPLSVGQKALFIFGTLCGILLILGGVNFLSLQAIERNNQRHFRVLNISAEVDRAAQDIERMQAAVLRQLQASDVAEIKRLDQIVRDMEKRNAKDLTDDQNFVDTEKERQLHATVMLTRKVYWEQTQAVMSFGLVNRDAEAAELIISKQSPAYDGYLRANNELANFLDTEADETARVANRFISEFRIIGDALAGIAIIMAVGTGFAAVGIARQLKEDNRILEIEVTERKLAEEGLRESEEKFRQLADNITDVFWVCSPDYKTMHYVSAGYELIWGRSAESLYARPHQWVEAILLEERERVFAVFGTLSGKEPEVSVEYRIGRPDGTVRWVHDRGFQVRNAAGDLVRIAGIATDITERKRAEDELFRSRETLRGILDHIPQRVFWKDRDLVYQGCNHAFALDMGFSEPNEVIGKTDFEANWKAMAEIYRTVDRNVIDLDAARSGCEEPAVAPDGRPMWIRTSKIPLHDRQGRVTGVLGTYEDITPHKLAALEIESLNADLERRVAQRTEELFAVTQEAEEANRAKSEFFSRSSHELRTPLSAILGFGQLLETEQNLGREARENLEQLVRAARRLRILIDKLLDISDVDSGRMLLSMEPVAVDRLVEETLSLVQPPGAALRVDLELRSSLDRHWRVLANPHRLKHVLVNLLSNAIKYNRPGGKVILECTPADVVDPPMFRFCVKDTGPGIRAENLARLFAPFDRLDAERTRIHVAGSGLGLAVSKRLIELMGGRIGVESTPGEGSTFWVEVPRAENAFLTSDPGVLPAIPNLNSEIPASRTLLYIEDNLTNLRLITRILARRPGIQLLSAGTSARGLEMACEHRPAVILLDLHLPDSHSDQALAQIRSDPRTSEIPVVMLSAEDLPGQREQMRTPGAHVFLPKPVEVRTLLGVIDRFIAFQPEQAG